MTHQCAHDVVLHAPAAIREQYEVTECLASALFGQVFKAVHRPTGDVVAIKQMELVLAARRRAKDSQRVVEEDVFVELRANMKLRAAGGHAHVLSMRDCFVTHDHIGLIMDYCAHGELLELLNRDNQQRLPLWRVMRYFAHIVQGVHFLHEQGIAHRDLSLENVLVDEQDRCQISDFGLAAMTSPMPATAIGKIHYMAPEACMGEGNVYDPFVADVWSLGVILFAMLTGRYPFREPLQRDADFRLLEDFGIDYMLEKLRVDVEAMGDAVQLLRFLLVVDPVRRPTLANLLRLPCFASDLGLRVDEVNPAEEQEEEEEDDDDAAKDSKVAQSFRERLVISTATVPDEPSALEASPYQMVSPPTGPSSCKSEPARAFLGPEVGSTSHRTMGPKKMSWKSLIRPFWKKKNVSTAGK
ncbi:TPA: hypothetical protein N0F65_007010 [Lagenidium giganteum]|uniref:Protein kinase domain-containing protein n=1 Tax=Lagenidium giganteum TaxID=4803 RepID=A0AAV2ZC45_9STRA|nr:TPA: hypothetical protein N0F65_007010 [Lagenidium giganteum]